ncbi:uncharacterized protein LOC134272449 [Saccostrea cucullata]|uniref:uncharacterized protein LOC134272449 n=1 Tax=Saccostrea cuccullata TaxID=36930 RepID=UPI002ED26C4C
MFLRLMKEPLALLSLAFKSLSTPPSDIYSLIKTGGAKCPKNETSWRERSKIICNNTGNRVYHCIPTIDLNAILEDCFISQSIQPNFCAVYNTYLNKTGFDQEKSCKNSFLERCPNSVYQSDELFKYPLCLEINPDEKCYVAESSCPRIQRINGARDPPSYRVLIVMLISTTMLMI